EKNGKIVILKKCNEHGSFNDTYWARADIYYKAETFKRPNTKQIQDSCPNGCGINNCDKHLSTTVMAVIDVTNECDLRCPVCFANASKPVDLYKPSLDKIYEMLNYFLISFVLLNCAENMTLKLFWSQHYRVKLMIIK
ncbi:MAG: hypothetical protein P8X91_06400, partial [Candidatus Bathyarchaeota archaeon]